MQPTFNTFLEAVAAIDHHLTKNTRHFRNKSGRLLTTLDQVIRAILTDDLATPPEGRKQHGQTAQTGQTLSPAPAQNLRQL